MLLAGIVLIGCERVAEKAPVITACAVMPDGGRASACACVLDGKAYVFGGRDSAGTYLNDLWQYDPQSDTWTYLSAVPGNGRVNATIASYGTKLYAGLGYSTLKAYHDTAYQRDWWEYTPETKQWKRLADFPNGNTVAAVSFGLDGFIYAIYGFGYGFTRDVWRYHITENRWEMISDNIRRAPYHCGGRGAWLDGMYYYGTGYNTGNLRTWWATDIISDEWTPCASIPGKGRQFSACAASKEYVYLCGGRYFGGDLTGGEVFDSYMRYAPSKDQWEWCGTMPCGRTENLIAFTIDGKAYFGLGEDEKGHTRNTLFRIDD